MKFLIEIERADGWRKLTTVRPQESGRVSGQRAIDAARIEAERCLAGWRSYFGHGEKLRIAQVEGW